MKLTFIGPATLAKDGGIDYPAVLDDKPLLFCITVAGRAKGYQWCGDG